MKRIAIVGGETHIHEVTRLAGQHLTIVGAVVRESQKAKAAEDFKCPLFDSEAALYEQAKPDVVAVANQNDLKGACVLRALRAGCDVVADKPLTIAMDEQREIEAFLRAHPERRLLVLLTLRGQGMWAEVRNQVRDGTIGRPAFCHVRMAVQLMRELRPDWFLDVNRSGGLFLDLLIHGIDQVEWALDSKIVAMTATMGNLGYPEDVNLRDHAAVYCELASGATAIIEGQRMLPEPAGADYRMLVAGTQGYLDLDFGESTLHVTDREAKRRAITEFPETQSVLADWLAGGDLVDQESSLRANRLSILATQSAEEQRRIVLD